MDNKKIFKVKVDDKELELAVVRPNVKQQQRAQQIYAGRFKEYVKPSDGSEGAIVRTALNDVLKTQGLWSDKKQAEFEEITKRLLEAEEKLASSGLKGNKRLTKKEGYEIALQMRRDRWALRQLNADRNSLDLNSAESLAENDRFAYLVSVCTVYNDTGKPYFESVEDYLKRGTEPVGDEASRLLGRMLYGIEDDFEKKLPENKFLLKHGFCNEKLHLCRDGKLVDVQGRPVDEDGNLIDKDGNIIDWKGNKLTKEGEYDFGGEPIFEDESEPVA